MGESNRLIQLVLLVTGVAIVAVVIAQLRAKREAVEVTAQRIHDQLDELDPVTRSAVIARLTKDAASDVEARLGRK
jgi:hypothetical protein